MSEIILRATDATDRAAVEAMLAATYPALLAPGYDAQVLAAALPMMTQAQDALLTCRTYFIGHDEDGVAVCAGGWTEATPGSGIVTPGLGHVRHVVTRLDRAGQGIGGALMAHIFDSAHAAGQERLECLSTLTAERFYRSRGFTSIEQIDVPMGPGAVLPSVRMMRPL